MKKQTLFFIIFAIILLLIAGIEYIIPSARSNYATHHEADFSLISLSPATTEMLYLLKLDRHLAGVTRYCTYPPDAQKKVKIGGYYDPNIELIAQINPSYVILSTEHRLLADKFRALSIPMVRIDNSTPESILKSLSTLGESFGRTELADKLISDIRKRIQLVKNLTRELPKPKVLIILGKDMAGGDNNKLYIVGKDKFYTPLMEIAGGENAAGNTSMFYPLISYESIIHLNPDIIIELVSEKSPRYSITDLEKRWESVSMVSAVKNRRLYTLSSGYIFIPGPRFVKILEDFFIIIHPEGTQKGVL